MNVRSHHLTVRRKLAIYIATVYRNSSQFRKVETLKHELSTPEIGTEPLKFSSKFCTRFFDSVFDMLPETNSCILEKSTLQHCPLCVLERWSEEAAVSNLEDAHELINAAISIVVKVS